MAETVEYELYSGQAPGFRYNSAGDVDDFKEGDVIESDLELDKMWPAKFIKVDRTEELRPAVARRRKKTQKRLAAAKAQQAAKPQEGEAEVKATKAAQEKDDGELEDVTDQFQLAGDNDFKVSYVPKKGYTILEGDKAVNDKPFRSSKEVNAHLEELTGTHAKKGTRSKK